MKKRWLLLSLLLFVLGWLGTSVPIKGAGLWSLHCIYMRPYLDKGKADWESFFATTTFFVDGDS